jgi:gliding motility-associated-like protein
MTFSQMYGLEFSPSGDILYMQSYANGDVRQFDLSSGNAATISASESIVGLASAGGGQLQTGPDGKIYCARYGTNRLSRINDPDELGVACNWEDTAVVLTASSRWGLPTFIQSFFNVGFEAGDHCFGDAYQFTMDTLGVDSVLWNFGDPASANNDTSTALFPMHTFTDTGEFTITLIAWGDTLVDTAVSTIFVYPRQSLDLGASDTLLCDGDTLVLRATEPFSTYAWHDASTADTFVVTEDGTYWVTLNGVCDTLSDTMHVRFDFPAVLDLGNDTSFCDGNAITINAGLNVDAAWSWNTGDSTLSVLVSQSGTFIFDAINGCGTFADTIVVEVIPKPDSALLPPDTLNCFDAPIYLQRPINDTITWLWSDSTDVEVFEVDTTMTVWLAAFNACGFLIDTFNAVFNGEIKTELGEDTIICDEDSIRLFATDSGATYLWNTGDTTDSIWSIPGVTENYILTISLRECQLVESRRVFASDTACPDIDCDLRFGNVFTPNGDGWNDRFLIDSDCDLYRFDMAIYNRWGQMVHFSSNVSFGWDGFINGEPAASGTYFFTVMYKDFVVVDSDRFFTRGSFTLLRE